jgi:glycosyltransferase involved in cell wall biosynthesis
LKLLFLRGQVPKDRDPKQIMYDNLKGCCDMWTQLAYLLCKSEKGELWYWGGKRKVLYDHDFIERWIPDLNSSKIDFYPDVIFARGGFPEYDSVLKRFPRAFKIYYGAGKRVIPQTFNDFQLILVDTPEQQKNAIQGFPHTKVELFIKPAAENIFYPRQNAKKYDVIFCANQHKSGIKGHDFILPILSKFKTLQVGIASTELQKKYPNITFTNWISRKNIPDMYAQSKIAIVPYSNIDSCPRVIPEALACNCPVLVLDSVNIWQEKYITSQTGRIMTKNNCETAIKEMIKDFGQFSPYSYYQEELSLSIATERIRRLI